MENTHTNNQTLDSKQVHSNSRLLQTVDKSALQQFQILKKLMKNLIIEVGWVDLTICMYLQDWSMFCWSCGRE
jgi:hypothetical protein